MINELVYPNTFDQRFSDGDPTRGISGTIVRADFLNSLIDAVEGLNSEVLTIVKDILGDPANASDNLAKALEKIYAKLDSPSFVGTPKSITPDQDDNSTRIATTEYVRTLIEKYMSGIVIQEDGFTSRFLPGQIISISASLSESTLNENRLLICNGALVSRTAYSKLFEAIGTRYGVGNGSTTFALPSFLTGDTIISSATGSRSSGAILSHSHSSSGSTNTVANHSHGLYTATATFNYATGTNKGGIVGLDSASALSGVITSASGGHSHTVSVSVGSAGGSYNQAAGVYTSFYIAY